jgi:hypothetical protein
MKKELSYQPTYEELKPGIGPIISAGLLGYQPTYEELKLGTPALTSNRSTLLPAYLRGIETKYENSTLYVGSGYQPTYEELKLVIRLFLGAVGSGLPAYLRGIETGPYGG